MSDKSTKADQDYVGKEVTLRVLRYDPDRDGAPYFQTFKLKLEHGMTVLDALFIGLLQGLAIAPGISRSGATISAGLMRGVKRDLAARFAFILAVPAILGANLIQLPKALSATFQGDCMFTLCMGGIAAFVSGYFAIKIFMDIIRKMSIRGFAYYCLAVGIVVVIFL